ncbi:MAG TPA: prepilin-type N-terminal cleavage/methylation domain-containing protein [Acetobacteraceae bacterium]|nr:prepilin-type N-terminal cleavage/methylation domain-containing protein [Acetobacteraceae bacterium]
MPTWLPPLLLARRAQRPAAQSGLGLLEVMIALVIAGLALTVAFRSASETIRTTAAASRYQEAVSRARSRLELLSAALVPGEQSGDDGRGYHWRTNVELLDTTGQRDASGAQVPDPDSHVVSLFTTTVWVTWREGAQVRTVRLDSQRLSTSRPGPG